jgi:hypothetical protein
MNPIVRQLRRTAELGGRLEELSHRRLPLDAYRAAVLELLEGFVTSIEREQPPHRQEGTVAGPARSGPAEA